MRSIDKAERTSHALFTSVMPREHIDQLARQMKRITFLLAAVASLASLLALTGAAPRHRDRDATPAYVTKMFSGYRNWKLISVAREAGQLDDVRAILGNDIAVKACREGKLPFPDGSVIARIAWSYDASEENNNVFAHFANRPAVRESFVAGSPKNGVQFMVKDSKKYAETGGWGYGHFNDGKPAEASFMKSCYPCHQAVKARDYVFTRYAP